MKLWTYGTPKAYYLSANDVTSGKEYTLRLENIDPAEYGEMKINAEACLKLADGTEISGLKCSTSLRDTLQRIDACYEEYTAEQLAAVRALIIANEVMQNWNLINLW